MPRDRYQRGHIEKVGKRTKQWKGHWYEYRLQPDGTEKRTHRSRILGRCAAMTKTEAQAKLDGIISALGSPQSPAARPMTVTEFVQQVYLPIHERTWADNTRAAMLSQLRRHILPAIGSMPVVEVRKIHLATLLNGMADQGYKHKSIVAALAAARAVFGEAQDHFQIPNPTRRLPLPTKPDPKAKPTLSPDQIRTLMERTSGRTRLLYEILLLLGLRIGEALTLRWNDVQGAVLRVDESTRYGHRTKSTKTGVVRLVPLPPGIARTLAGFRETTFFSADTDFIFGHPASGKMMVREVAYDHYLHAVREATGIGALLDFRICRRTCATRLKERGVHDRDIQALLGHSQPEMTRKHYIQPVEESQAAAVVAMERDLLK